ncbi:hypothetical protein [uncultured Sphaerochaeta sp.]|uniref:hypothetical protein n=1 Tax=uncultured Sphaerochaeta sp. TaxID=886478 RepID=UPI002A0A424A|nr:hypothetical protein [uncultured Sphaerochaeta sp.]
MIAGFESFSQWFRGYEDQYVIIGGTACSLLMSDEGQEFRATKDIDLVLIVDALTPEFGTHFWKYVVAAGYQHRNKSTGEPQSYCFSKPENQGYPWMIELFSRRLEAIDLTEDAVLTPLPIGDEVSSLSAILLDDAYYDLLKNGRTTVEGITVLDAGYIILFKAKAWLDFVRRKREGEQIDSKNIKKHKNDVFRLSELLSAETRIPVKGSVRQDIIAFINVMRRETVELEQLGIMHRSQEDILTVFEQIYGLQTD